MSTVTLDEIKAQHSKVTEMIERFERQSATQRVTIGHVVIELRPGERYAGVILADDGTVKHHLILMAKSPEGEMNWHDAMNWAASIGGSLPTRQEQALLYANCKPHLKSTWHWSSETHESDASRAWDCDFSSGIQIDCRKSYEGYARAVRRLNV